MPQDPNEIVCFTFEGFELRKHGVSWILRFNGKALGFTYRDEATEILAKMLMKGRVTKKDVAFLLVEKFENPNLKKKKTEYTPELKDYVAHLSKALRKHSSTKFWENVREIEGYAWTYTNVVRTTWDEAHKETQLIAELGLTKVGNFIARNQEFVELNVKHLKRYEDFKASDLQKTSEFCVALGEVFLERKQGSMICEITIPKNPFVAYDVPTRDYIEKYPTKTGHHPAKDDLREFLDFKTNSVSRFLARVTAGGSITLLRVPKEIAFNTAKKSGRNVDKEDFETYFIVAQRDASAPVDSLKLCPQSGISECMRDSFDWQDPRRLVIGEFIEELRFIGQVGGKKYAFYPSFARSHDDDKGWVRLRKKVEEKLAEREHYPAANADRNPVMYGLPSERGATISNVNARILSVGKDRLTVNYTPTHGKGEQSVNEEFTGILAIDSNIGVVDFMAVVEIEIPVPLANLSILDGEVHKNKFLRRRILALKPEEFRKLVAGVESKVVFFGCAENIPGDETTQWLGSISGTVGAKPKMAIPLAAAAPIVLEEIFGIPSHEIVTFDQKNTHRAKLIFDEPDKYGQPV